MAFGIPKKKKAVFERRLIYDVYCFVERSHSNVEIELHWFMIAITLLLAVSAIR